jgi:cytoplasmic iron level regulating protein YaaA (DUF328/UPF0246 family)
MKVDSQPGWTRHTQPEFLDDACRLVEHLRTFSPDDLAGLMSISAKLALQTAEQYAAWATPFTLKNARQAILAFGGDVYADLQPASYSEAVLAFAQDHLRILSGLYGILRPLDLIQAYRLEMAYKLKIAEAGNLYAFWRAKSTGSLLRLIAKQHATGLVNLASAEYLRAINLKDLHLPVITPVFKEKKGGQYKFITVYAKRARGAMCDFIIRNRIRHIQDIKAFNQNGYRYKHSLSSEDKWVFGRG